MTSWQFLLIGSFAALGAALAVGTAAALLRYHRTGSFPGGEADEPVTGSQLAGLWLRVVVGLAIAVGGGWSLAAAGLL